MNAGGVDKACKSNGRITWDVIRKQTQNTDIHKKPNKTQNSPNLTNVSSFVLWEIVLCLDFVYCVLESFRHRASRDAAVADEVVISR